MPDTDVSKKLTDKAALFRASRDARKYKSSSEHPQFLVIKGSRVGQVYSRLRIVEMGVLPESRVHER